VPSGGGVGAARRAPWVYRSAPGLDPLPGAVNADPPQAPPPGRRDRGFRRTRWWATASSPIP